jgi:hypothetical protein
MSALSRREPDERLAMLTDAEMNSIVALEPDKLVALHSAAQFVVTTVPRLLGLPAETRDSHYQRMLAHAAHFGMSVDHLPKAFPPEMEPLFRKILRKAAEVEGFLTDLLKQWQRRHLH